MKLSNYDTACRMSRCSPELTTPNKGIQIPMVKNWTLKVFLTWSIRLHTRLDPQAPHYAPRLNRHVSTQCAEKKLHTFQLWHIP